MSDYLQPIGINAPRHHIPVLPAELMTQPAHGAVFPPRFQAQHPQCLRHHQPLLAVVRRGYALEHLQALHGLGAAVGLVRDHAADGTPEHLGGRAVVPGPAAGGIVAGLLAEEGLVLYCWREVVLARGSPLGSVRVWYSSEARRSGFSHLGVGGW